MMREIGDALGRIAAAEGLRVVVLRGAGGNFSAGGDLDLVDGMIADWDTRIRVWREARDIVYNVINCSKPVVAATSLAQSAKVSG